MIYIEIEHNSQDHLQLYFDGLSFYSSSSFNNNFEYFMKNKFSISHSL